LFAAPPLGVIFVLLNTCLVLPEISYLLGAAAPALLVVASELEEVAAAALARTRTPALDVPPTPSAHH
jgi:acyl-CoA synthetase (AMP-forming)/AMP-acid ligase II